MEKIIDAHTHIFPEKIARKAVDSISAFYDLPMHCTDGTLTGLLAAQQKAGISCSVISSVATVPEQAAGINTFIAGAEKESAGRALALGSLHPYSPSLQEDLAHIHALGLHGIKLHPDFQRFDIDDRAAYPIYEYAQGRWPLLLHTGDFRYDYSHPRRLARVLTDFPHLTVIAAHFGGWSIWQEAPAYLARFSHLYVDTCSALYELPPDAARKLIDRYGAEKVLFGTDFPMWDPADELALFNQLPLTPAEREQILFKNASVLYSFQV